MFKKGFTLSEVLITLAVIAIVAMLVIPSFMKDYKKKVFATKIIKAISQIQKAVDAEMAEEAKNTYTETVMAQYNSCSDAANGICEEGPGYFLNKYFKLIKKNCAKGVCYANSYKSTTDADAKTFSIGSQSYAVQTADGVTIVWTPNASRDHADIFIDTNGLEGPNVTGYDAFYFILNINGKMEDIDDGSKCNTKSRNWGHIADYAIGCYNRIIEDGGKITY